MAVEIIACILDNTALRCNPVISNAEATIGDIKVVSTIDVVSRKKLTNHSRLSSSHSTVIGQFLTA